MSLAVSKEAILQKMMQELKLAMEASHHERKLMKHIAHIHILSELLLDHDQEGETIGLLDKEKQVICDDAFKQKDAYEDLPSTLFLN